MSLFSRTSFSLDLRLRRHTIPWSLSSFKGEVFFFFSLSVLCAAWLWDLGFFHIPNHVLTFLTNKKLFLMCFHLSTNRWQLLSLKVYHVLALWLFLPQFQSWSPACFSADAHMANREWSSLMPMSTCTDRESWREKALPLPLFC